MKYKQTGPSRRQTKVISSSELTSECWSIQFWGLPHCRTCEYLATEDCGGYRIRKATLRRAYPKDGVPDINGRL